MVYYLHLSLFPGSIELFSFNGKYKLNWTLVDGSL
jgi:hypothetical protein